MEKANKNYKRTIEELKKLASMFWPQELSEKEAERSIVPKLIETQDQFITILSVDVPNIQGIFDVIDSSRFPGNLFVKHLQVLADYGGEPMQRLNSQFRSFFPKGVMDYLWDGKTASYSFTQLPLSASLTNDRLGVSGKKLLHKEPLNNLLKDVSAILLFGSASINEEVSAILSKCDIGSYLGKPDQLQKFIKQRYIWVSRITGGAQANTLGQLAQKFVCDYLKEHVEVTGVSIKTNGSIPGITDRDTQTDITRPASFDVVVSHGSKYVGIEVSFQVTTNSTIERKANQARFRFDQIKRAGYKSAHIIDGAGNFQRESAIRTLCENSHCTVAFSRSELDVLCDFLKDYFEIS